MTVLTVGAGGQFTTISAAVAAAHSGDTIDVKAGTYTNDFPTIINGLTIEGVGGAVHLVATVAPPNGKGIFDVAGNTTLRNLDFSGAAVADGNGAGVRYEGGNLVIQNSSFHSNQDGILAAADPAGSISIDQSEFYANGAGDGRTHNLYIGDIAQFTLTNSYVHDANTGHEVKSRAENNTITNNRIFDNGGNGSYAIDLPNGGNATISGNTIEKGANAGNPVTIAYGEEGSLHAGTALSVTNNAIVNDRYNAYVMWNAGNATVTASGNGIWNFPSSQIDMAGTVSGAGFTALAARPALSTASPIASTVPDTTPPTLTAAESLSGLTNHTTILLSGTVSDGGGVAGVELYDVTGGRTVDLGHATIAGGAWSFTATGLADGSHQFSAVATDLAGNAASLSAGPAVTVDTAVPHPAISIITGNRNGSVTLAGTSKAGSAVSVTDTVNGQVVTIGTATTAANGTWRVTSATPINVINVHSFAATALDPAGNTGATAGEFILTSKSGADTLTATPGVANVFAAMSFAGADVIHGFQTASAVGAVHDTIDLSGRGFTSFTQVQAALSGTTSAVIAVGGKTITLADVAPSALTAADFRYS